MRVFFVFFCDNAGSGACSGAGSGAGSDTGSGSNVGDSSTSGIVGSCLGSSVFCIVLRIVDKNPVSFLVSSTLLVLFISAIFLLLFSFVIPGGGGGEAREVSYSLLGCGGCGAPSTFTLLLGNAETASGSCIDSCKFRFVLSVSKNCD